MQLLRRLFTVRLPAKLFSKYCKRLRESAHPDLYKRVSLHLEADGDIECMVNNDIDK
jgi:hypothetical protein